MDNLRSRFLADTENCSSLHTVLVTAVKLPTGAVETITNTQLLPEKIEYIRNAYDDNFCLKANPNVQIIGYMLV